MGRACCGGSRVSHGEDVQEMIGRVRHGIARLGGLWADRRGGSTIEFALAFLVVIPVMMGTFDLGQAVYIHSVVAVAAQEAARYGIVHRDDVGGMQSSALSLAVGLDPSLLSVAVTYPDSMSVEVVVSYQFTAVTPGIGALFGEEGGLSLSSTARMSN